MAPVVCKKVKALLSVEAQRAVMGQRFKSRQIMTRVPLPAPEGTPQWGRNKYEYTWTPKDVPEFEGWLVGFRWKLIGYTIHHGFEDGTEFIQTGRVFVALLCKDPRHEPIPIPWPIANEPNSKEEEQDGETSNRNIDTVGNAKASASGPGQ